MFLDALTSIGLLQKKGGVYRNSPITEVFLVESSQTFLGEYFEGVARSHSPVLENLLTLVKEGPVPTPETTPFSEEMVTHSAAILANYERTEAQEVVKLVSKLPEFSSFRKMLDLGGGPGLFGIAIVAAHPNMKGVVFDLPAMVKVAKGYIKEYEMENRMTVVGGDFNRDSIGEGFDLVLASGSLQFAKNIDAVVKKVYDALKPRGVFTSLFPFGQTHERTKPEHVVLGLLSTAMMGLHRGFDQSFVADSMLRVGFRSVRSHTWDSSAGPIELDVARK
jgi:ubiquinone/menaquinone biosynthesis C-methylase UbiE